MKNIEHEDRSFQNIEIGDENSTYEKKGNDPGSLTVYAGNQNKLKTKKKLPEKVIFLD